MGDQEEHLTEAQKQILRLEKLRAEKEKNSKASFENALSKPQTQAEQSIRKLTAMREMAKRPGGKPKLEGKIKSFKSSLSQTQILERLKEQDSRLKGSVVSRIAINRLLNIENSQEENDLESRISEILRQFNTRA
jgi:hypothetical protein